MTKRKICVVTGTRAEYGLLYWLLKELKAAPEVELQLIVTGAHLSPEFGYTANVIETDGFEITERVEMLVSSDTAVGIAKSMGLAIISVADVLNRIKPDILVVLGDRYEILAVAQAAMVARIPIAHIHGGEATEGLIDEAIRHAVTKMSHLHFVAAEDYKRRVIQLGEQPDRVFNVGAVCLDNIDRLALMSKRELEEDLGFYFGDPTFLVTYHPVTLNEESPERLFSELLKALDDFPTAQVLFTGVNADAYGRGIKRAVDEYAHRNPGRVFSVISLGQRRYLSAMRHADAVIGNSSSALLEAPAIGTSTVNIGDRQKGRLCAPSVISCDEEHRAISMAIKKVLTPDFKQIANKKIIPYGTPGASKRIADILGSYPLREILFKRFFDIQFSQT